jgi:hypothetical protein
MTPAPVKPVLIISTPRALAVPERSLPDGSRTG